MQVTLSLSKIQAFNDKQGGASKQMHNACILLRRQRNTKIDAYDPPIECPVKNIPSFSKFLSFRCSYILMAALLNPF